MKVLNKFSLLLVLMTAFSLNAVAQDAVVDAEDAEEIAEATASRQLKELKIVSKSNPAAFSRDENSPRKFRIELPVQFEKNVCKQMGTKIVYGPDYSCGTYIDYEYSCGYYPGPVYCDRFGCRSYPGSDCRFYPVRRPLSCDHPVNTCVQYGIDTYTANREVLVVFKKNTQLKAGEREVFQVKAKALAVGSPYATFDLEQTLAGEDYEVKRRTDWFSGLDKLVVKKK